MTRERLVKYADDIYRATRDLLKRAEALTPAQLDAGFDFAMGTLRRQLGHMAGAEHFWFVFLSTGRYEFRDESAFASLESIRSSWAETELIARVFIESLTEDEIARSVKPLFWMPEAKPLTVPDACQYVFERSAEHRRHALEMLDRLGASAVERQYRLTETLESA